MKKRGLIMKKKWGLGLAALALAACDAKKIPITGTRVAIVDYESSVKVDADAKDTLGEGQHMSCLIIL
jgi:hypothetical protein